MLNLKDFVKTNVYNLENKNQFVIEFTDDNNNIYKCFQSYSSLIAIYCLNTKELFINWQKWDYSKTTLKHLKIFINRYTYFEYESKNQFMKEIKTNSLISTFNE